MKSFNINELRDADKVLSQWEYLHDSIIHGVKFSFYETKNAEPDFMPAKLMAMIIFESKIYFKKRLFMRRKITAIFENVEDVLLDWRNFKSSDWTVDSVKITPLVNLLGAKTSIVSPRMMLNIGWNFYDENNCWIVMERPVFSFISSRWKCTEIKS